MNQMAQTIFNMIENSPAFAQNPNAREMLRCIKEQDSEKGERIARNLCNTYGVKPEQALNAAKGFFHL